MNTYKELKTNYGYSSIKNEAANLKLSSGVKGHKKYSKSIAANVGSSSGQG